jgi:hypothetical protein
MLVHKKEGKEQDTPASASFLRYSNCRASIETRPDKPHMTWLVAELGQSMVEAPVNPALLGAADGDPEHQMTANVIGCYQ